MSLITGISLPNVKRFFRPDPGYIMFDVDLAGADAQIVAWEANDEPLKQAFRDYAAGIGPKIHCINAKDIFGDLAGPDGKKDPYYSRAKAGVHLCVADGHEALTPYGWAPVQEISHNMPILICEADGAEARWEVPTSWYHAAYEGEMLKITGASYEQLVTPNHKMPYFVDAIVRQCQAKDLPRSAKLPKTVSYSGPKHIDPYQLRLLAAFHADGSIAKKQVRFHLKKERKLERLYWILGQLGVTYYIREYGDGTTNVVLPGGAFYTEWLIAQGKAPTISLLQYSAEDLDAYIAELPLWDGCQGKTSQNFTTAVGTVADVIHTLLHLRRHSGTHHVNGERSHTVQINNRPLSYIQERRIIAYTGAVHCPTVSTGFWFTRYHGRCAVTGNTNYNGQAKTAATSLNISIQAAKEFQARWFHLHPGIKKWHEEVWQRLLTTRTISNKFGFSRTFFDRITPKLLGEALAWIPQSTVALTINYGYCNLTENYPEVENLLQVHDSLTGQCPIALWPDLKPLIKKALEIPIPYDDPLIIPTSLKTSTVSWGDCKPEAWDD